MGERKLAHIEKIADLQPIPGYDRVVYATVLGWKTIVGKDEFKIGDWCVYFEIDSKLPEAKWSEFLRKKHFKVKTQKMCKVISQGLALPLESFASQRIVTVPDVLGKPTEEVFSFLPEWAINPHEGDDVTHILGVTYSVAEDNVRKAKTVDPNVKYKSMAARHPELFKKPLIRKLMKKTWGRKILFLLFGKKKDKPKSFPEWIDKTDETRCLNGNTKIDTNIGKIRIADIVNKKMPVLVKSYNSDSNVVEYKKIVSYQKFSHNEPWVKLKYTINKYGNKENSILCTFDHQFYTDKGYVKANNLKVGDKIYTVKKTWRLQDVYHILGMVIGDSHIYIDKRKNQDGTSRKGLELRLTQGINQIEYLFEKIRLLDGNKDKIIKGKSGYCNNVVFQYCNNVDYCLTNLLYDLGCIIDGKFHITQAFCDLLTPQALAFWYMDDGTLRNRDAKSIQPTIQISTNSETKKEIDLLIKMLKNRFGIECNYRKDRKYGSIYITAKGTKKFLSMITKYMPYNMRYKTIPEYEKQKYVLENLIYAKQDNLIETKITECSIKKLSVFANNISSYDIEVEGNHNFFANGLLVHNCENIPHILQSNDPWTITEKLDGTSCTFAVDRLRKNKNKFDYIVCSRNVRQTNRDQECYHDSNIYWELSDKYDIENKLKKFANEHGYNRVVLQGEGIGNVQGNPYKLKENDLYLFNLVIEGERVGNEELVKFCNEYGFKNVPIIDTEHYLPKEMEELKLEADGYSVINPKVKREGFVYRSFDGKRSFKNVSRTYLLKHNQ